MAADQPPETPAGQPVPDDPVHLTTFANIGDDSEAARVRGALDARGIPYFVNQRYNPYELGIGELSEIRMYVGRNDLDRAREALEKPPAEQLTGSEAQEFRVARERRRIRVARWFLYAEAIAGGIGFLMQLASPIQAALNFLIGGAAAVLAVWSWSDPRRAFGAAVAFQTAATVLTIWTRGPLALLTLIPLLAVYFAWEVSAREVRVSGGGG